MQLHVAVSEWYHESHAKITTFVENVVFNYSDADFRMHFRLTRTSVELIWNRLAQNQASPSPSGKPAIPTLKSILVTLWLVGSQESYRSIADRFGISKSSVYNVLNFTRNEIIKEFGGQIRMPSPDVRTSVAKDFEKGNLLPGVLGAVDGSFIPIPAPSEDQEFYFNRKKFHAIVLQAVSGPDMRFYDCNVGWPGSVHDLYEPNATECY